MSKMEQKSVSDQFESYYQDAVNLLKQLIATSSFSGEEKETGDLIGEFLKNKGVEFQRKHHNILAKNRYFDKEKPSILLNSHHDTVKPNKAYTRDPFEPAEEDGKLYGLGSNDAGGALVSLIAVFCHFYDKKDLNYNLILAATAADETTGA